MKKISLLFLGAMLLSGCGSSSSNSAASPNSAEALARGAKVYGNYCLGCHQVDGTGVPMMQPALINDPVVNGETTRLIRVVLGGPESVLPAKRDAYSNQMPKLNALSDADTAAVLTYVRQQWGNTSGPVTEAEVAQVRSQFNLGR